MASKKSVKPSSVKVFKPRISAGSNPATRVISIKTWQDLADTYHLQTEEMAKVLDVPKNFVVRLIGAKPRGSKSGQEKNFQVFVSEAFAPKLDRISKVSSLAVQLFAGNEKEATRWLTTPKPSLGNESPLIVASTPDGALRVERILQALAHGDVA